MMQLKKYFFALMVLCLTLKTHCTQYARQPHWNASTNCKQIEKDLSEGIVASSSCIFKCEFAPVFLLTLSNGLQAIFKPRPYHDSIAEVAAYNASRILKQNLVPPTVIRTIDSQEGSLQLYVKPSRNIHWNSLSQKLISDIMVFSFIWGRLDWNKTNNLIISESGHPALIDNCSINRVQETKYGHLCFWKDPRVELSTTPPETNRHFPFNKSQEFTAENIIKNNLPLSCHDLLSSSWRKYFVIYKNNIWFQSHPSIFQINYTPIYSKSTLKEYLRIDHNLLKKIWNVNNFYDTHKDCCEELFEKTMNRKKQLLSATKKGRLIP